MKLLTKEISKRLPKLYATENIALAQKEAICKFFTPDANWTWYVIEGEQQEDDYIFFGYVIGFEKEFGYFSLKELESVRGKLGLPIERDRWFTPTKLMFIREVEL